MKTTLTLAALLVLGITIYFIVLGYISRSSEPPGLALAQLSVCPPKPNCVCSEGVTDNQHHVDPIPYLKITNKGITQKATMVLESMGASIIIKNDSYIAATFTSRIFGFVDDFEIRLDSENQLIHLRSAARVGYSDMGINKKRVETFRKNFMLNQ